MLDIVVGLQWGDEGKGKIVDVLTENYDIIARFQGGPNAGHTLKVEQKTIILHLIPSGILHENKINVIGNGVVFDPIIFQQEINQLQQFTSSVKERIIISNRAHLILPTHRLLDTAYEKAKGKQKIGSTLRGIGPTYADKISRTGLRVGEIFSQDFEQKLKNKLKQHVKLLEFLDYTDFDLERLLNQWLEAVEFLRTFKITNTEYFLNAALSNGQKVLAEGAQGTLLDIDFGTYPFVTSSNTIASNACTGLGVSVKQVGQVYGVFKAYTTRVGNGPFPTELFDQTGEQLRIKGNEFGATTGRPRRTGWLDLVALYYAVMLNGVDVLIMTKADVLSGFEQIKVATAYRRGSHILDKFDVDLTDIQPVYETMEGWQAQLKKSELRRLPSQFLQYVEKIEGFLGKKIKAISIGPSRYDIIWL